MKRIVLAASLWLVIASAAFADTQTTAFTYQGNLTANGAPASGNFDLTFTLFDAATDGNRIGAPIVMTAFPVVDGHFTTDLDFPTSFTGQQRWVEVSVGTQTLSPRQPVNSVPVAQYALSVRQPSFGQFLPSQIIDGMVVTCGTTSTTGTFAICTTLSMDGTNVNLAAATANRICNAVTGKGYNGASGQGVVAAPYFNYSNGQWVLATTGTVSPLQQLYCNR